MIFRSQVFLDVIESVNLLASATGNVLRSEIVGCIKMRVYLSGMPELRCFDFSNLPYFLYRIVRTCKIKKYSVRNVLRILPIKVQLPY